MDAEHALDMQFAEGIGVNTKDLLFVQPDYAEQALDTVDHFVRSTGVDVIVVDSVTYKLSNFFLFSIISYVMFTLTHILVLRGVSVPGGRNAQNNMVTLIFEIGGLWQVAALVPKAELEGDMGDSQMALQARLMSKALRRLTHSLNSSNCLLIFINQVLTQRTKIWRFFQ